MPITIQGPFYPSFAPAAIPPFFGPAPFYSLLPTALPFNFINPAGIAIPEDIRGVYVHGVTLKYQNNLEGEKKIFLPLNIGIGFKHSVLTRLKSHYYFENLFKHPIFELRPKENVANTIDNINLINIYNNINNYYHLKPRRAIGATYALFNNLIVAGLWDRVLWHNHINFFNGSTSPGLSHYANNGQSYSMINDHALFSNPLIRGGNWLNDLQANRQLLVDKFTCFYAPVSNPTKRNLHQLEGKVKWLFEQFGYFVYSHANHMNGLTMNIIPPTEFDFTAINNQLIQGVLTNPDRIIPPNIPDLVNII